MKKPFFAITVTALLFLLPLDAFSQVKIPLETDSTRTNEYELVKRINRIWTGDLPQILNERKFIRVLVSYSDTNFFVAGGEYKGLEYEMLREYEQFLNRQPPLHRIKTHIVFIAVPFNQVIPDLVKGRGDIAAAGLTITPARKERVAFTSPYISDIDEIVVASKEAAAGINKLNDLAGKQVYVVSGSSYIEHLKRLIHVFEKKGLEPIDIVPADITLEAEDLLQMVNAGIYDLTVIDSHIAQLWSKILPKIVLKGNLKINTGGKIAWAVRKRNPKLLQSLNQFVKTHRQGTLLGNILMNRYYNDTTWIKNPITPAEQKKLERVRTLFKKYARSYNFDWLKIAAIAYQESGLDQTKKSPSGAVGIMQIRPQTAADSNVGISNITLLENNIHAGVKYLAFLRNHYFSDPLIKIADQIDFTVAAYNAGPAKINQLRRTAKNQGLDPNIWYFNVENVARRIIGRETVQYVANINKYYIAYKTIEFTRMEKSIQLEEINHGAFGNEGKKL